MSASVYLSFLAFAIVLIIAPGPDFAVVVKNTLAGGRRRGMWCATGVSSGSIVQGVAAAAGLGALITQAQPVFQAIKWAGIAYLVWLAVGALRSAIAGEYGPIDESGVSRTASAVAGWRQGFLCNITNPKVLVFYLAVLPQFLGQHPTLGVLLLLALSHAVLGLFWLWALVLGLHRARLVLTRRTVRRSLDALTGGALLVFGARLATE